MIATALGYFITAALFILGVWGLAMIGRDKVKPERESATLVVSIGFIGLSWLCAYLGGF